MKLRTCTALLLTFVPVLTLTQSSSTGGKLDSTRAFWYPGFGSSSGAIAETAAGPIRAETYLRYLAARHGTKDLDDLVFDVLLERECKARRLARAAVTLARSLGTRRFYEAGRKKEDDPDGSQRLKFRNDALRQLRIDALVQADRKVDDWAVQALFERRYGVGGEKVKVRQILVSFRATKRRLEKGGDTPSEMEIERAAKTRAYALHRRLREVAGKAHFEGFLKESDDRLTKRLLRDPKTAPAAGVLEGYNYVRYGPGFAKIVRSLDRHGISEPVRTKTGFHIVQLLERKKTAFADVAEGLHAVMRRRQTTPAEVRNLRRALFDKYAYAQK